MSANTGRVQGPTRHQYSRKSTLVKRRRAPPVLLGVDIPPCSRIISPMGKTDTAPNSDRHA